MFKIPIGFSRVDVIHQSYHNCVKNNVMDEDCFVKDAKGTIKCIIDTIKDITLEELSMSGIDVKCSKSLLTNSRIANLRFVIGVWKWKFKHFVIMDGKKKDKSGIIYDPLENSLTVKYGKLIGARIITRA